MNNFLLDWVNFLNNVFAPVFSILSLLEFPVLPDGIFTPILYVFALLAFFNDPLIFPIWFSASLDFYIFTIFAHWIMSFVRWLADIVPIW